MLRIEGLTSGYSTIPVLNGVSIKVEEGQFVRALFVVTARDLDRISGVAQSDELDALDDAAFRDVEAGNDALRKSHAARELTRPWPPSTLP